MGKNSFVQILTERSQRNRSLNNLQIFIVSSYRPVADIAPLKFENG